MVVAWNEIDFYGYCFAQQGCFSTWAAYLPVTFVGLLRDVWVGMRSFLSGLGGCFDLRWLCANVTHSLPLSRGEVGMLFFLFDNE